MRLSLRKTTLHDLTPDELSGVVGGLPIPTWYDGCDGLPERSRMLARRHSMKLTLKRETLTPLTDDELAGVAGGITTILIKTLQHCPELETVPTFPVLYCATDATS